MQKYLPFATIEEAAAADKSVVAYLHQKDGSLGSQWSGVFTNGTQFGILWDSVVGEALGVTEHGEPEGEWVPYVEPVQPEEGV